MPKKITLPNFLKKRLEESDHDAVVGQALKDFGKWFADESKQTFFPDYTNHGIQHIEQVLDTATNLIPEKAREYFSAADAAALVLAVLLHDSALHISKAGFHYLIKGPKQGVSPYVPVARFDQADWGQAWSDFMFLARRWDDQMLLNVFGPEEGTDAPRAQVRDPFDHWSNLSETDELLIGEFIRKHHPRLAHEMALHGVPGKETIHLKLADDLPPAWPDLVGLIARSHGLPLRTSVDYLRQTPHFGSNGQRSYQNVHAIYLMALLRVADYVQIQGDRTTERIFTFKDIPSLISRIEHKVHNSDVLISDDAEDPESLQIDASPKEVAVFLRLKEWLAGIQQELDSSWAVLGEVYGRYPKLRKLGLAFRRVRSNLDNVKEFAKNVPYVPDRIRFDVARAELLKLLIGPLYGDDPSYGVRELMQNSIDAVREYDQFVLDNPEYASVSRREQEADVVVELGQFDEVKGYAVMTISDRGIGMTEATVRDYFLRAGASYRRSAEWKNAFETGEATGARSKVVRSGRFGIGVLAAFLISDRIDVITQHITADESYQFTTTLDTETIAVDRKSKSKVGTQIALLVNKTNYNKLIDNTPRVARPIQCNWYVLDSPSVVRRWPKTEVKKSVAASVYMLNIEHVRHGWRKLQIHLPYDIYWSFDSAPVLTCNGIFVTNTSKLENLAARVCIKEGTKLEFVKYPNVRIIDPDGLFPLNIQRNDLRTLGYSFGKELIKDFLTEMLAWLFFEGPDSLYSSKITSINFKRWLTPSAKEQIIACSKGYSLKMEYMLSDYKVRHVINCKPGVMFSIKSDDTLISFVSPSGSPDSYDAYVDGKMELRLRNKFAELYTTQSVEFKRQLFFSRKLIDAQTPVKLMQEINSSAGKLKERSLGYVEEKDGGWITVVPKQNRTFDKEFELIGWKPVGVIQDDLFSDLNRLPLDQEYLIERFYPDNTYIKSKTPPWLLDELWQEHFGKDWIPFALEDRIAKFPKAAQFFKERYPQVVPDEAWALLGGKPAGVR